MWEVTYAYLPQKLLSANREITSTAKKLLADGWEPFAVAGNHLWLRRLTATLPHEEGPRR